MAPKVVTATDEADLAKQLERAEMENAEVSTLFDRTVTLLSTILSMIKNGPGVDVMITIFGEKNDVFLKTNVMIKILHNLALSPNVNFFAEFFGGNIEKIIASVPEDTFKDRPLFCYVHFNRGRSTQKKLTRFL
jgi:hypothetical protein